MDKHSYVDSKLQDETVLINVGNHQCLPTQKETHEATRVIHAGSSL
jgi:hypothetical protein